MVTICDLRDGGVTLQVLMQDGRRKRRWSIGQRGLLLGFSALSIITLVSPAFAIKEKPFIKPVQETPAAGTAADFVADKLTYDPATKTAVATGRVVLTYGPYTLNATRVTYNQDTDVFTANGSVELREPNGNIMQAAQLELHNRFKQGFARHLKALLTNVPSAWKAVLRFLKMPTTPLAKTARRVRASHCGNWFLMKPPMTKTPKI
jgi:hypothetical protein